jgi:hypothetical protein
LYQITQIRHLLTAKISCDEGLFLPQAQINQFFSSKQESKGNAIPNKIGI